MALRRLLWTAAMLLPASVSAADQVAVVVEPLSTLVAELLAPGSPKPVVLLPSGRSPETYDPRPSDLARLQAARLYLGLDLPFERQLGGALARRSDGPIVVALQHEVGHDAARLHVWLSPARLPALVESAAAAIERHLPAQRPGLAARRQALLAQVAILDAETRAALAPLAGRTVMVWHPAWSALAADYGFRELAVERDGKEPTAADLRRLEGEVTRLGLRHMLLPAGHLGGGPQALVKRLGLEAVEVDPLSGDWRRVVRRSVAAIAGAAR
jgi:zinc transport system substrate-binding protein